MLTSSSVRVGLVALALGTLHGCASATEGSDCVSHYDDIASAPTWGELKEAMLGSSGWGRVASIRTQARGHDVGAGDQDAVRVVDLLDRNGRRLVQADVWRAETGGWRAGVWNQCID